MWHVARMGISMCFDPHAVDQPLAARYGLRFRAIPLLSAPPGPNVPHRFSIFLRSETPSRFRCRPLGVVPRRGALGAILGTFVIRAQGCVRRTNLGSSSYVHVAPSNLGRGCGLGPPSPFAARATAICCATSRGACRSSNVSGARQPGQPWPPARRPARRRDRPYRMLLAKHCRSGTGQKQRADPFRRQGPFSARGVDLALGWSSKLPAGQNAPVSQI